MATKWYGSTLGEGFGQGLARAGDDFDLPVDEDSQAIKQTREFLEQAVKSAEQEMSERFLSYMGEIVGVATAAREANGFPPLTLDEISRYVEHSADILDSLKHA